MEIRLPSRNLSDHNSLRLVRRYDLLWQWQLRLIERRLVTVSLVRVRVLLVVLHHLERRKTHDRISGCKRTRLRQQSLSYSQSLPVRW